MLSIVAKQCMLHEKLLLKEIIRNRIQEIDWYRNEWPWPLVTGCFRSCHRPVHKEHWSLL